MTELVEQQAAISEVLRAVASSPHDLRPIFDTILINGTRLCEATFGGFLLVEEKGFRMVARRSSPDPVYAEQWPLGLYIQHAANPFLGRLNESRSPVHIADLAADQAYLRRNPRAVALVELAHVRTCLLVPLLKDNELIGVLGMSRQQVQPFTDRQIDLVRDFAAQATIALEGTRREWQYREMQRELAHASRVATMGQLTASIAHEIKQPIATARNNARAALNFLDKSPPDVGEVREALACIVNDTDRASDVVDRIRSLVKKTPLRKEVVGLNAAILEVTALTRGEAVKTRVTVRTQLAGELPRIQCDRVQLQQVMLNLIVNAIRSMSGVEDATANYLSAPQVSSRRACASRCRIPAPG